MDEHTGPAPRQLTTLAAPAVDAAMARYQLLQPGLEQAISLAQVARDAGISSRTLALAGSLPPSRAGGLEPAATCRPRR
jgi:hypothetical protein